MAFSNRLFFKKTGERNSNDKLIIMYPNSSSAINIPCPLYCVNKAIPSVSPFNKLIGILHAIARAIRS